MNLIGNILNRTTVKDKLNILTIPTHESYESNLALTGHNFYSLYIRGLKTWNETYRKCPDNYILIKDGKLPNHVNIDVILIQHKFGQFQFLKPIAQSHKIPTVVIEHTFPYPQWNRKYLAEFTALKGDINVFISECSQKEWKFENEPTAKIIYHGIDTNAFAPKYIQRENTVLSVANEYITRDVPLGFSLWKEAMKGMPVKVVGNTPGLSKPAKTLDELIGCYQTSKIFLNTSQLSPIPTTLLEAASSGCGIVTTGTCMIPEIFKHEENALIGNTATELRTHCERLLKDNELCKKLGEAARKTILDKFSLDKFITNWNNTFKAANEIVVV